MARIPKPKHSSALSSGAPPRSRSPGSRPRSTSSRRTATSSSRSGANGTPAFRWQQENPGYSYTLRALRIKDSEDTKASYEEMPVSCSVMWNLINGHRVMFYYGQSALVDWRLVKDWISKVCQPKTKDGSVAHCDAMNFAHCINAILPERETAHLKEFIDREYEFERQ